MHKRPSHGFTLVELLIVIAIIGVLAAMLLPVINSVRSRGLMTACTSNLRQVGTAMVSYSADRRNRGRMPHEDKDDSVKGVAGYKNYCWFDAIDEYIGTGNLSRAKQCPAWSEYNDADTIDKHTYKMNSRLCNMEHQFSPGFPVGGGDRYFVMPEAMKKPSETILIFDGRVDSSLGGQTRGYHLSVDHYRHDGSSGFIFCDGHVEFFDGAKAGIARDPDNGWIDEGPFRWNP